MVALLGRFAPMDELARRAIGDLHKRMDLLVEHQNQTDKRIIGLIKNMEDLTAIAVQLAGLKAEAR